MTIELRSQTRDFLLKDPDNKNPYTITVLPTDNAAAGETLIVRGSTDTGEARTVLYEFSPKGNYTNEDYVREGYVRTVPLYDYGRELGKTFWEISLNTTGLLPGDYFLKISAPDTQSTVVLDIELQDVSAPRQTKAEQTPGFGAGILVPAFIAAVILGAVRKK